MDKSVIELSTNILPMSFILPLEYALFIDEF